MPRSTRLHRSCATVKPVRPCVGGEVEGAAEPGGAEVGRADLADLAGLDQRVERDDVLLLRHLGVVAVRVVEVDVVGPQPAQRVLRGEDDVAGAEAGPVALARHLGVDLDPVAAAALGHPVADLRLGLAADVARARTACRSRRSRWLGHRRRGTRRAPRTRRRGRPSSRRRCRRTPPGRRRARSRPHPVIRLLGARLAVGAGLPGLVDRRLGHGAVLLVALLPLLEVVLRLLVELLLLVLARLVLLLVLLVLLVCCCWFWSCARCWASRSCWPSSSCASPSKHPGGASLTTCCTRSKYCLAWSACPAFCAAWPSFSRLSDEVDPDLARTRGSPAAPGRGTPRTPLGRRRSPPRARGRRHGRTGPCAPR